MKKLLTTIIPLLLILSAASCENLEDNSTGAQNGDAARNFTLKSVEGETEISLEDYRGKPVVLNFWASWCGPCKEELPLFESTWKEYKDKGVVFLGVDVMDDKGNAAEFIETEGITYTNLHDPSGEVSSKYGVVALPATFFIDKEGNIAYKNYGPLVGEDGKNKFSLYLKEITK
jgi:DsbE subfamily thiol:disulfide oxidoreductase